MRDHEQTDWAKLLVDDAMEVGIPVLIEAVGAIVFIACAMLLVVVLAAPVPL